MGNSASSSSNNDHRQRIPAGPPPPRPPQSAPSGLAAPPSYYQHPAPPPGAYPSTQVGCCLGPATSFPLIAAQSAVMLGYTCLLAVECVCVSWPDHRSLSLCAVLVSVVRHVCIVFAGVLPSTIIFPACPLSVSTNAVTAGSLSAAYALSGEGARPHATRPFCAHTLCWAHTAVLDAWHLRHIQLLLLNPAISLPPGLHAAQPAQPQAPAPPYAQVPSQYPAPPAPQPPRPVQTQEYQTTATIRNQVNLKKQTLKVEPTANPQVLAVTFRFDASAACRAVVFVSAREQARNNCLITAAVPPGPAAHYDKGVSRTLAPHTSHCPYLHGVPQRMLHAAWHPPIPSELCGVQPAPWARGSLLRVCMLVVMSLHAMT